MKAFEATMLVYKFMETSGQPSFEKQAKDALPSIYSRIRKEASKGRSFYEYSLPVDTDEQLHIQIKVMGLITRYLHENGYTIIPNSTSSMLTIKIQW